MAILPILKFPEPVLQRPASPVEKITDETRRLLDDMVETMYAAPGVGLAAPQVGVSKRIVVLDPDHENPGRQLIKLINPELRRSRGEVVWEEGCLSIVDFTAEVKRAAWVEVVGLNEHGEQFKIEGEGLLAVALQHEIDHLDGILFIDRISRLKRDLYKRRLKKRLRSGRTEPERPQVMI
ncbi:MAG TPA: peptide deformylase [Candidatus Acidoferrales bacterium]|nr:peptide deformylase [Candidatus Acidoferrales bacterium]